MSSHKLGRGSVRKIYFKMGEGGRVVKINALLCFVLHSHKRQSLKTIRSTVKDFYQTEIISEAKNLLLCDF